MSGSTVSQALQSHFDRVRRAELERLQRRLAPLSDHHRESVEAIVAHVVRALAEAPAEALVSETHPRAAEALVRLFNLDMTPSA
jgi:glutamyl-tRNA reductase